MFKVSDAQGCQGLVEVSTFRGEYDIGFLGVSGINKVCDAQGCQGLIKITNF